MRVVTALGGNALLRRGEPADARSQRLRAADAAKAIAPLASRHQVVVTHGNGPQVGLLALQAASYASVVPYPLDLLVAESQGLIGYLFENALCAALPNADIVSILTRVEIDLDDPAFARPDKAIGPVYDEAEARRRAGTLGWAMAREEAGWRRAVASPLPKRICEIKTIRLLIDAGVIVICAGGGGIPVPAGETRTPGAIEAVIDKDRASALLAEEVGADVLLLLMDEPGVWPRWPARDGDVIRRASVGELKTMLFEAGTMRPKIEAARDFVERTGGVAAIGALDHAAAILAGEAGTIIERNER